MEKEAVYNDIPTEIEILEFKAGGNSYGINVNDIREILPYENNTTTIPNAHPFIEGITMPRDFLIPVIDFGKSLKLSDVDEMKNEMLIVTEINELNIGFHVDSVRGIYTKSSTDIMKPSKKVTTNQKGVVTGIIEIEGDEVELVDLRKIINIINPDLKLS